MQAFSWVCAHLVGAYAATRRAFILETLGGTGQGVLQELKRLRDSGWGTSRRPTLNDMIGGVHHYLWRRPDSLTGSLALQWKTSRENRAMLMNRLRDQIAGGAVLVRSPQMLAELERVRQKGDEFIPEGKRPADHRVFAGALAVESWASQLRPAFVRVQGHSKAETVLERSVAGFFDRLRAQAPSGAR